MRRSQPYQLCMLTYGPTPYVSRWPMVSVEVALRWARVSGLCAWTGPGAIEAGYGPEGRPGRVWIEETGKPAVTVTRS